jgi:hypothetical protein
MGIPHVVIVGELMEPDFDKICFVIMPIGSRKDGSYSRWKDVYENIIKPAVQKADSAVTCFRADDETKAGGIIEDIISHLHSDFLCIADITERNPNVYYELGLIDSWHNRTILITQKYEDAVFDKFGDRTLLYHEKDLEIIRKFENDITVAIKEIIANPNKLRNPVQRFIHDKPKSKTEGPTPLRSSKSTSKQTPSAAVTKGIDLAEFKRNLSSVIEVMGIEKIHGSDENPNFAVYEKFELSGLKKIRKMFFFWKHIDFDPKDSSVYARFARGIKTLASLNSDVLDYVYRTEFIFPYCGKIENEDAFLANLEKHFHNNKKVENIGLSKLANIGWLGDVTFDVWDVEDVKRLVRQHHLTI